VTDTSSFSRRRFHQGAVAFLGAAALLPVGAFAQSATLPSLAALFADGTPFDATTLLEYARQLSRRPYSPPANDLPDNLASLSADTYAALQPLLSARRWGEKDPPRPFAIEPLHRGFVYTPRVDLFCIQDGKIERLVYAASQFDISPLKTPPSNDIGFSGLRLFAPNQTEPLIELQGATFFKSRAKNQPFGVIARALTIRPAHARGEEFPLFRALFIERPSVGSDAIVIHGLLDSESVVGVIRLIVRTPQGSLATIVDTELTLLPRTNLDVVGIGGMGASYLYASNERLAQGKIRPNVFEVNGLHMRTGVDEWIWRPLNNPETLQISAFVDKNPRGFGLLQRQREASAFLDASQRYEARPSLWIEPLHEWGEGSVQLLEIPSDSEGNDNILAFWRPKDGLAAGVEARYTYRQFWCDEPPERPTLRRVQAFRMGRNGGRRTAFLIDLEGEAFPPDAGEIRASVTSSAGAVERVRTVSISLTQTRLTFDVDAGSEKSLELRAGLVGANGAMLSETWLWRLASG
jgi:periplasmic glucans biosynthesis protein